MIMQAKVLINLENFMRNKDAVANKGLSWRRPRDDQMDRTKQKQRLNAPYTEP